MSESTQEERDKLRAIQSMVRDNNWSQSILKTINDADRFERLENIPDTMRRSVRSVEAPVSKETRDFVDAWASRIDAELNDE